VIVLDAVQVTGPSATCIPPQEAWPAPAAAAAPRAGDWPWPDAPGI